MSCSAARPLRSPACPPPVPTASTSTTSGSASGPPLLWLNGSGSHRRSRSLRCSRPYTDHFEVLIHDQRGLGRTEVPPVRTRWPTTPPMRSPCSTQLGLERPRVLGHQLRRHGRPGAGRHRARSGRAPGAPVHLTGRRRAARRTRSTSWPPSRPRSGTRRHAHAPRHPLRRRVAGGAPERQGHRRPHGRPTRAHRGRRAPARGAPRPRRVGPARPHHLPHPRGVRSLRRDRRPGERRGHRLPHPRRRAAPLRGRPHVHGAGPVGHPRRHRLPAGGRARCRSTTSSSTGTWPGSPSTDPRRATASTSTTSATWPRRGGGFRDDPDDWVAIVTGVPGQFMTGADLKTYIPQITELQQQIQARRRRRDRRLPPARRHRRGAPQPQDLQADHRGGRRPLRGRRHGDARRHRHPHRHRARHLRRDGAQARPLRRRRHHRAPPPPARLPGGHGVPAHRRGLPRRRGRSSSACSTRSCRATSWPTGPSSGRRASP